MSTQQPSSVPVVVPNALPALSNSINQDTSYWALANGGGSGVSQLVAGSGITLDPSGGTGVVTVATVAASPFAQGMIMMWQDGFIKCMQGKTPLEEVVRVSKDQ